MSEPDAAAFPAWSPASACAAGRGRGAVSAGRPTGGLVVSTGLVDAANQSTGTSPIASSMPMASYQSAMAEFGDGSRGVIVRQHSMVKGSLASSNGKRAIPRRPQLAHHTMARATWPSLWLGSCAEKGAWDGLCEPLSWLLQVCVLKPFSLQSSVSLRRSLSADDRPGQ